MLISLNWLKQYIDIKENIEELSNALTMIGQEVENIEVQGKHLDNVVVGKIVEYDKHPNSDKLTLVKVDVADEILQIVCGAPNHKLGDKVAVAKIGAVLDGDFKIKKSKIRDVESYGMLCSEVELGIGSNKDGIIIFPEDAPIGKAIKDYLALDDVVFELEITPNRPDCLSYIGIAREIAAFYNRKVKYPEVSYTEAIESTNTLIKVNVEDKERCKRYMGKIIKGVTVKESPKWLQDRIISMGLHPINNIVDLTNFIMFEYNQPMHAFDLDKLEGNNIYIREAKDDEKITTLDGNERILKNKELVIADEKRAVAIAGIIGGQDTCIDENTKNIFIEIAYFTPDNIRKTSRNLGIFTDSSYRNERGMDRDNLNVVMARAVSLIQSVAGGEILSDTIDKYLEKKERPEIALNIDKLNRFVGKEIDSDTIGKILVNLNMTIKIVDSKNMIIIPPSYREDLTRTADIYEEIIRMYGFENIEEIMPEENINGGRINENFAMIQNVKEKLSASGLTEVINYSFIPSYTENLFSYKNIIKIKNPLSEDMSIMRPSLSYSLLNNILDNLNRNESDLKIFEVSKTFEKEEGNDLAKEDIKVGIALCGRAEKSLWDASPKDYNFYTLKGYVEFLFESLQFNSYQLKRSENSLFHPGASVDVYVGKELVGYFGEIHPEFLDKFGIKKEKVFFAEFNLTLLKKYIKNKFKYENISKYPVVYRDLAIVLERDILVGDMIKNIKKSEPLIEKIDIFDIYQGEKIDANKKSVAISIALRDKNKTLSDKEIDASIQNILKLIADKYKGELRQQ